MRAKIQTDALKNTISFFENLSEKSLDQIPRLYESHARFCDPFNDVIGIDAINHIFADMFAQLDSPAFVITTAFEVPAIATDNEPGVEALATHQAFVTWDFTFRFKRYKSSELQTVKGSSHLVFSPNGKLSVHHDYWDAAHQLYERLPVIGMVMRRLRKKLSSTG
ncbi:MAG: nuclear transport factor 2 family protein [Burkholderiaceae bacterium]